MSKFPQFYNLASMKFLSSVVDITFIELKQIFKKYL